jgi:pimeloyl-ACP methyl ester carboxylesterase
LTITTSSGLKLQGSLFRTLQEQPRGLILFCHELDSNRWSALYYCEGLLAEGFNVLAFDFRNHGDSASMSGYEPSCWLTRFEVDDVLAAVAYIDSRPDLRSLPLGVFGVSRGGGAALMAAARCDAVRRVATDGCYSCYEMLFHFTARWAGLYFPEWILRMQPLWHVQFVLWVFRSVSQFRRGCRYANIDRALDRLRHKSVFMLSGERDTYVIPQITRNLHARTRQDPSGLWIVPGAKHNLARQTATDEYDRRLVEFFLEPEDEAHRNALPSRQAVPAAPVPAFAARPVRTKEMTVG